MNNYFKHKMRGKSPGEIAAMIIFGIIAITGLAILFGFVVMWLWNWLMPDLFGLPTLTFWKAAGVIILSKILLGGCGGRSGSSSKHSDSGKSKKNKDFSKWAHYDKFWEEHGDKAYQEYCEKMNGNDEDTKDDSSAPTLDAPKENDNTATE